MCARISGIALLLLLFACSSPTGHDAKDEIRSRNTDLERAFVANKPLALAAIYHENACMIPQEWRVACGKAEIEDYWTRISEPVDWKLDVILVSKNENELYQSAYYQELELKPRHWSEVDIELPDSVETMYELGHSALSYRLEDGTLHEGHVDFILVWIKIDGEWEIFVDTYV
jgi:ketosteroid isomerase-like protein